MKQQTNLILRGDIYYADLSPVVGSEQGGVRPVLILQNDTGNKHSPTVIVAAITSREDKPILPTHVAMKDGVFGLRRNSIVLLEQVRTIDRCRLCEYIGHIEDRMKEKVDVAIKISLGLEVSSNVRSTNSK